MKLFLIIGIIAFCVIGFLIFIWFISREQVKSPIEKVNNEEKKSLDFIKQRQTIYSGEKTEVQKIAPLNTANRGALFQRAIERKQKNYEEDDEEYNRRLEEKRLKELKEQEGEKPLEEFKPIKHSLSSFIKSSEQKESEDTSEEENSVQKTDLIDDMPKKENEENKNGITQKENENSDLLTDDRTLRIETKEDLNKRKMQVENKEQEKKFAFQKFKNEILLEAENLKKRREEFTLSSNAMT